MSESTGASHAVNTKFGGTRIVGGTHSANLYSKPPVVRSPAQSSFSARSRNIFNTVKLFMNPFKTRKDHGCVAAKRKVFTPVTMKEKFCRGLSHCFRKFKLRSPFPRIAPTANDIRAFCRIVQGEWKLYKGIEVQSFDQWEIITQINFGTRKEGCYVQKQYDGNVVLHLNAPFLHSLAEACGEIMRALLQAYRALLICYLTFIFRTIKALCYAAVLTILLVCGAVYAQHY